MAVQFTKDKQGDQIIARLKANTRARKMEKPVVNITMGQGNKPTKGNRRQKSTSNKVHKSINRFAAINSNVSAASLALIENLTLPKEYPPIRVKRAFSSTDETAVAAPFVMERMINTSNTNGSFDCVRAGQAIHVLTRDPTRYYGRSINLLNGGVQVYVYTCSFSTAGGTSLLYYGEGGPQADETVPPFCHAAYTSGAKLHGTKLYCVNDGGKNGMWFNYGERAIFTVNAPGNATFNVQALRFDGVVWEYEDQVFVATTAPSSTVTYTVKKYGYYTFVTKMDSLQLYNCGITINNSLGSFDRVFGWLAAPFLETKESTVHDFTIAACSLLVSNVSPVIQRGGQIVGAQLGSDYDVGTVITNACGAAIGPTTSPTLGGDYMPWLSTMSHAVTMDWAMGMYGYMRPNERSFELREVFAHGGTTNMIACKTPARFTDGTLWIAYQANLDSASYPGGNSVVTATISLEYKTPDMWVNTRPPSISLEALSTACDHLKQIPQFHENPIHVSQILREIAKGIRSFVHRAPKYLNATAHAFPSTARYALPAALGLGFVDRILNGDDE